MYIVLALLLAAAAAPTSADSSLLSFGAYPGALCLDGSPSGVYLKRGSGVNASKFIFWFEGGGWAFSADDAASRAGGRLGSSKFWTPTRAFEGILSENATLNADFASWTTVYWAYCDGSSFTSRAAPRPYNSTLTLHFGGLATLEAGLSALAASAGLAAATDVVVSGSSAGGLSAFLHVDHIAAALPAASVVAMPDAGFFPAQPAADGSYVWTQQYEQLVALYNISAAEQINAACFEATPTALLWTCLLASSFYARIASPVFMLQSVVDWAQLASWAGLPPACLAAPLTGNCSAAQLAVIRGWTTVLQGAINASAALAPRAYPRPRPPTPAAAGSSGRGPPTNGGFFAACIQHEQGYVDRRWAGDSIGGRLMKDAFADWLFGRNGSDANHWLWDVAWPGNDSCQPPGP